MPTRDRKRRLLEFGFGMAAAMLVVVLSWPFWAPMIGDALVEEDPLEKADAILVLGAARIDRTYEAGLLHQARWAPLIILSPNDDPHSIRLMTELGVRIPTFSETQRSVLVQMGVQEESMMTLPDRPWSTAGEARLMAALAERNGMKKVIVVTSRYHTARAGVYFRKAAGGEIEVIVRGSRHDPARPDQWWKRRRDQWDVFLEYLKLPKAWLYPASRLEAQRTD